MAVANNWQQTQGGSGTILTYANYAVGAGNNKILVVTTGAKGSGTAANKVIPTTVKWGTLDLTIIKSAFSTPLEGGSSSGATIWGLLAPAAETHDIVVTWPESQTVARQMGACYLVDREQVLPTTLTATMNSVVDTATTKWTLTINSVPATAYVVDCCSSSQTGGTHSATETATGQVQKINNLTGTSFFLASEREVAADANVTFGWVASLSSGRRGMCMAAFKAAAGAGVVPNFVATGAASSTTGSSIAPAYPAAADGLLAGDLFVLHCVGQGQTTNLPTVSAPSGWSTLYSSEGANNQCKQWIFARDARATGSETGTLTVDCTTPGTNGVVAGAIYAFHNVVPGATFTEDPDIATGTGVSIAPPAVTAGNARLCCAFVGVGGNQTPPSFTAETGGDWTARATSSGATGDGYCLQLQTANVSNATITGGAAAITSDDWVVRAFALISFDAVAASSLADAAPTVGQPAVGQKHALAANNLATTATLGQPRITKNFLTATSLLDRAPLPGQPGLDQLASLGASSLAGQAPTVGQPAVGQTHALAASALSAQPALAHPTIGQKHVLAAAQLSAQPALAHPTLGQKHALAATSLADRQPVPGQPAVGQKHALAATGLSVVASILPHPVVGQKHALSAAALADRAPVPGQPAAVVVRHLTAASMADQAPTLGQAAIGQKHALTAGALVAAAPVAGAATIGQSHVLATAGLVDLPPILGRPTTSQTVDQLDVADAAAAAAVQVAPQIGQKHALAAASLAAAPFLGHPAVGQTQVLAAAALTAIAPILVQATLKQAHGLAASSLAGAAALLGASVAGQKHALAATAIAAATPVLAHPALGQAGFLSADEVEGLAPMLASPTVGQEHVLTADALATTAPVLEQAAVAQGHHLAATGLASGAALLDHASLTIGIFGLAANDLGSAAGILEQADARQEHALAAADQDAAQPVLDAPVLESFLPGVFIADDLDGAAAVLGSPKVNWREIGVIKFTTANTQAKVDTFGARPAYASAGAGISSAAQFGALAPLAPNDAQPGDLLLWVAAEFDSDHESANVAPPTGYAQLTGSPFGANTSSYAPRLHIALKTADGSEAGNPQGFNYALTSGDAFRRSISARVFRVTATDGFAASAVEGIAFSEDIIAGDAAVHCPPVAPAGVNRLGLIVTVVASAAGDVTSAGGIWQQALPEYQSTTGGDCTIDLQWAALAREPGTGAQIPYGVTGAAWVSAGFALAPPRTSIDVASAGVLIEDLPPVLAKAVNM